MSQLLECLRTASPLPSHAAALAHYSHQAALAAKLLKPAKPFREFFSRALGTTVRVVYELDTEPAQYQFGSIAVDLQVLEIWVGAWEAGEHLSESAANCVYSETMKELGL